MGRARQVDKVHQSENGAVGCADDGDGGGLRFGEDVVEDTGFEDCVKVD